jgi:hypothetical protein
MKAKKSIHNEHAVTLMQYDRAIDLYLHEDELVWNKISQLITYNFALITATGFAVTNIPGVGVVEYFLCLLGLFTSVIFYVSIRSGIAFLIRGREQAKELEETLGAVNRVMRSGPEKATTQILQPLISGFFIILWISLFVGFLLYPNMFMVNTQIL